MPSYSARISRRAPIKTALGAAQDRLAVQSAKATAAARALAVRALEVVRMVAAVTTISRYTEGKSLPNP